MTIMGESKNFKRTVIEVQGYREGGEDAAAGRPMRDEKEYTAKNGPEGWAAYVKGYQESQRLKNEAK